MTGLGWSAPSQGINAGTARRGIFWQHGQIRVFLDKARAVADSALDGEVSPPDAVASVIGDLHSLMEVHLTFEEKVLIPLFSSDLTGGGAQRVERLLDEHTKQRGVLADLHREARNHPMLPTLAAKLAFLTSWLLTEMQEEERSLEPQAEGDRDHDRRASLKAGGGHEDRASPKADGGHEDRARPKAGDGHEERASPQIDGGHEQRASPKADGGHEDRASPKADGGHEERASPQIDGGHEERAGASDSAQGPDDSAQDPEE